MIDVGALVNGPDVVVLVHAHRVRERHTVAAVAELLDERAVLIELEETRSRRCACRRTRAPWNWSRRRRPRPCRGPGGSLKKLGTESKGISGVVARAVAGPETFCVSARPPRSSRTATTLTLKRRIIFPSFNRQASDTGDRRQASDLCAQSKVDNAGPAVQILASILPPADCWTHLPVQVGERNRAITPRQMKALPIPATQPMRFPWQARDRASPVDSSSPWRPRCCYGPPSFRWHVRELTPQPARSPMAG